MKSGHIEFLHCKPARMKLESLMAIIANHKRLRSVFESCIILCILHYEWEIL